MTEDDTYKRLKGLSKEEAILMHSYYCTLGMDSPDTRTIGDVRNYVNERLRPYGWSCDMLDETP